MAAFAADAAVERGAAVGVLYGAAVGLTALHPGPRSTFVAGVAAAALTVFGHFVSPPAGPLWQAVADRSLTLLTIGIAVALVWHHKRVVAQRDRAENFAARSERQLFQALEASAAGMLIVDDQGRIASANVGAQRLFGYSHEELLGRPVEMLVPELCRDTYQSHLRAFPAAGVARRVGQGRGASGMRKDGGGLNLEICLVRLETRDGPLVVASVADAGRASPPDARRVEQKLARLLVETHEAQRKRMAREIHDALGQSLTALKLEAGWLAGHLPDGQTGLRAHAVAMEELAARTIDEVRRLSAELRPAVLDDHGLLAAIRWQVGDFQKRSGLRCSLILPDNEIAWDAARCTVAYRVLQESLTNVVRHAKARHVSVVLRQAEQADGVLEVHDDGCGIGEEAAASSNSLGLLGMRERALMHDGSLTVTGVAGGGTSVVLRLPCTGDEMPGGDRRTGSDRALAGRDAAAAGGAAEDRAE